MHTIMELIQNMSHSSLQGGLGVTGILVFFALLVGAGLFRAKEMQEQDKGH